MLLALCALAVWPRQNAGERDGVILASGVPTDEAPQLCESVELPHSPRWQPDSGLPGVNAEPVIVGDTAYVLYSGGPAADEDGGARVAAVSLCDEPEVLWSVKVSGTLDVDKIAQPAAPYYDAPSRTLYVPVTYSKNILDGADMTASGGTLDSEGRLHLTAGQTCTVTIPGVTLDANSALTCIATGIFVDAGQTVTGSAAFQNSGGTWDFGESYSYWGGELILYNNGSAVPAGNYTVTLTLHPKQDFTGSEKIRAATPCWQLFALRADGTQEAQPVICADGSPVSGAGQLTGPITAGSRYLYFGIYDGDGAYYQYDLRRKYLSAFCPDDSGGFYEAGAAVLDGSVVFGSERGRLYSRPIGDGFASAPGVSLDLRELWADAGAVRSCIRRSGGKLYLTTESGYLWQIEPDLSGASFVRLKSEVDGPYAFVGCSSPVISESGRVYANVFRTDWTAADGAYKSELASVELTRWDGADTPVDTLWMTGGGLAQGTPVVYRDGKTGRDYVYCAVNNADGQAVCLAADASGAELLWSVDADGSTPRGLAVSGDGYMAFGSSNNRLFLLH